MFRMSFRVGWTQNYETYIGVGMPNVTIIKLEPEGREPIDWSSLGNNDQLE